MPLLHSPLHQLLLESLLHSLHHKWQLAYLPGSTIWGHWCPEKWKTKQTKPWFYDICELVAPFAPQSLRVPDLLSSFSSSRLLMRISSVTCGVSTSTPLMFPCTKSLAKGPCRCAPKLCAAGIGQWASKRTEHGKDKDANHTHLSYQHICEPSQLSVSGIKTMCWSLVCCKLFFSDWTL